MKEILVYDYEEELKRRIAQIEEADILPANKKLITDFVADKSAEVSPGRVRKYAYLLLHAGPLMEKDIRKFSMSDFKKLISLINNDPKKYAKTKGKCSEWYKADMRTAVKTFIKWLKADDYNPKDFEWLRTSLPSNVKKSRVEDGQILSVEEVEKLIASASNTRDKALISVAYETGCRPSEILTLRIGNINFDQYGAIVNIQQSKTKPRPIRIISAATYLRAWINIHPLKDNQDGPLWLRLQSNPEKQEVIGIANFGKILKVTSKRAGIKKRMYPYVLRHSRTTHLTKQYPDQVVKKITGHSPTSKHFEVYLHMTNQDVDNAVLKRNGLLRPEEELKNELEKPIVCWNCKTFNSSGAKICESCNFSLDISEMAETLKIIKDVQDVLPKLMKLSRITDSELKAVARESRKK